MIENAELMTVAPDEVVVTFTTDVEVEVETRVGDHAVVTSGPYHVAEILGLEPATDYVLSVDGAEVAGDYLPPTVTTLDQPPGEHLATVATVNDVHFGEVECGRLVMHGQDITGEVFVSGPAEEPYPELMNRAAIEDMTALDPDAVIVKGDLTNVGSEEEYGAFLRAYSALGERMRHVRGNHDAAVSDAIAATGPFVVELPGALLAVLDTVRFQRENGQVTTQQLAWLDELCAEADRPVLVFGHHHPWDPGSNTRSDDYFGINPDDSEALVDLARRHDSFAGYFAGHTHRNRVRRFDGVRDVPFVEVACVKDYPGSWAEYRIHEGGYAQVHRRITDPRALEWTEKTRQMFHGMYRDYALGPLDWRCFTQKL